MEERPFKDKAIKPEDAALKIALGNRYEAYLNLIGLVDSFSHEWRFLKSSGWMLKVFDRQKALFYLIPLDNAIKISLSIREQERDILLLDDEIESLHNLIRSAKKYVEGFALQFDILTKEDLPMLVLFLNKLIAIRMGLN